MIGGTTESIAIAKAISQLPVIITVATESARSLYAVGCKIRVARMDKIEMESFCWQNKVTGILDASHPYAVEVSQNAIATAKRLNLSYLRYERSCISTSSQATVLDSFSTLLAGNYLENKRVLLTIGCKALPLFKSWQERATLFTRVLPKKESLQIAEASGFTSDRTIALRPPITRELETALWQQWQISTVVTKASGKAGGEDIKQQVAAKLNIPLIIISRPQVLYPQQTDCINKVVAFCHSCIQ